MDSIVTKTIRQKIVCKGFLFRIPSDFPWPKLDQSSFVSTHRSSRVPLSTITNRISSARCSTMKKNLLSPLSVIKTENLIPIMNSNTHQLYSTTNQDEFEGSSSIYSDQLQVSFL